MIDSGTGINTVSYAREHVLYWIVQSGVTWAVTKPDGVDTLTNIERLQFPGNLGLCLVPKGPSPYRLKLEFPREVPAFHDTPLSELVCLF